MPLAHEKINVSFGARILDTDLRSIKPDAIREFLDLMDEHAVCAVPHNVPLTNSEHIKFSKMLGPIERSVKK